VYAVFGKTSWYECEGESDDVRRYRIAAEQGDAEAQHYLGVRYADGRGVTQDPAEGMRWIRKAAEQGLLSAQYSLGVRFTDGKGIPKDYVRAHQWLSLAKRTELAAGPYRTFTIDESLAILEPKMAPDQIAEAQRRAREWWEKHEKTE
jgi:TPR repeat protein